MMELNLCNVVLLGLLVVVLLKFINHQRKQRIWKKWEKLSKNKVILHGMYGQGQRQIPTPSPFVLKVETYLRMAKISYEIDNSDIWGPKGKTPWMSINGINISDSQFIIEFLGKKFDKRFDEKYSDEKIAVGTAVRVMMEEYMYWGGILWRFSFGGRDTLNKVKTGQITLKEYLIFKMIAGSLTSMAYNQGLGRHSEQEVLQIMTNCLRSLSKILKENKFLLGDPSEVDCAVFGQLASCVFLDDSPFKELFKGDLQNVYDYCHRMKNEYFPDWNELLSH